jgi:hypothetical protein
MEYKTLRYPGHAKMMAVMRDIGLMGMEPIEVKGVKVVPRDVFISIVGPKLKKDYRESPDQVAMRVEAEGIDKGERVLYRFDLLDRYDADTCITAMMRTTGFSLAITGAMQAAGNVKPGVWTISPSRSGRSSCSACFARTCTSASSAPPSRPPPSPTDSMAGGVSKWRRGCATRSGWAMSLTSIASPITCCTAARRRWQSASASIGSPPISISGPSASWLIR